MHVQVVSGSSGGDEGFMNLMANIMEQIQRQRIAAMMAQMYMMLA